MNKSLNNAKVNVNDEFYTMYSDIEDELVHYVSAFRNKVVYCNCDGYESNFVKFFIVNFKKLGIKKLIATGYNEKGRGTYLSYDGKVCTKKFLYGNGDFNSDECWLLLDSADIVVTNPPFSLFRDFIDLLVSNKKQFIIIGTENAVVYKNVFPLVKNNEMWCGFNLIKKFINPNGEIISFGNICWWTNVNGVGENKWKLNNNCNSSKKERFDNYNAININKVADIPTDYKEPMGVPISFAKYYDKNVFEILGLTSSSVENAGSCFIGNGVTSPLINGKKKYARIIIKRVV